MNHTTKHKEEPAIGTIMKKSKVESSSKQKEKKKKKEDGRLGWISVEEAQNCSVGNEPWWNINNSRGQKVELRQYVKGAPKDRPICRFDDGSMYLGPWQKDGDTTSQEPEGFGIYYWHKAKKRGLVYIGNLKGGLMQGRGEEFWLESSKVWKKNELPLSWTEQEVDGELRGVPNGYIGQFRRELRHDPGAVVILKDGTCRVGPWKNGNCVGNWNTHERVTSAAVSLPRPSNTTTTTTTNVASAARRDTKFAAHKRKYSKASEEASKKKKMATPRPLAVDGPIDASLEAADGSAIKQDDNVDQIIYNPVARMAAVGGIAVGVKQEDNGVPYIIELVEDSDQDISLCIPKSENVGGNSTKQGTKQDVEANKSLVYQNRIKELQQWIASDVIGHNPDPERTELYARNLYRLGFDSIELATAHLDESWINGFDDWMAPLHKAIFLKKFTK